MRSYELCPMDIFVSNPILYRKDRMSKINTMKNEVELTLEVRKVVNYAVHAYGLNNVERSMVKDVAAMVKSVCREFYTKEPQ